MPHSLVLNLVPQSPIYPEFLSGRHYHALFLTLISSVDRDLGDYLHSSNTDKAFTLSPLQVQRQREGYPIPKKPDRNSKFHKHHTLQYTHEQPIPQVRRAGGGFLF